MNLEYEEQLYNYIAFALFSQKMLWDNIIG